MNGRLALVAVFAAAAASCNAPTCGMGTKQVQQKDGTIQCVAADSGPSSIPCDVDAGATIVGGQCVSAVTCGPGTTLMNGQCVGTGGGGVPQCGNPSSNAFFCISGALLNFEDNSTFNSGKIHVAVYDPLSFLGGQPPLSQGDFDATATTGYIFPNVQAPSLPLIVVVTNDVMGGSGHIVAATGDQGIAGGGKYRVDAYVLNKSTTDSWKSTGSFDIATGGAYVAKFYNDPKPPVTLLIANEKNPVMSVVLTDGAGTPVAGTKYFSTDLKTLGAGTSTSAVGAAVVAAPVMGSNFPMFSGMGGGITWEVESGGSVANAVLISRFHPNM